MPHDARRLQFDVRPRKRRLNPKCRAKRRYNDEPTVRAAGMVAIEELGNTDRLWCYRCRHCSGWHLTSNNQGGRWLIVSEAQPVRKAA